MNWLRVPGYSHGIFLGLCLFAFLPCGGQPQVLVLAPVLNAEGQVPLAENLTQVVLSAVESCSDVRVFEVSAPGLARAFFSGAEVSDGAWDALHPSGEADFVVVTRAELTTSVARNWDGELQISMAVVNLTGTEGVSRHSFLYTRSAGGLGSLEQLYEVLASDLVLPLGEWVCPKIEAQGPSGRAAAPETSSGAAHAEAVPLLSAGTALAERLNEIRQNPARYSAHYGVDLSYLKPRSPLQWNDTLAAVALRKAQDMYRRNYFDHVDPDGNGINILIHQAGYALIPEAFRSPRSTNTFESISAGYTDPLDILRQLLVDEGVQPPGHRHHLLGHGDFWGNCTDIGLAILQTNDTYGGYCVILIAKHDW